MNAWKGVAVVAILVVLVWGGAGLAQEKAPAAPAKANEKAEPVAPKVEVIPQPFVVAVLDFETKGKQKADLGVNIADLLSAFLSMEENLQLVERAQIKKIIEEMALGKTGIVKPEEAAKIGHMTGAKFLVTGRAFVVGKQLYITSKIMSTETSKVAAQMAKGSTSADLDVIVQDLAVKLTDLLVAKGASMMPKVLSRKDMIAELKKQLAGRKLPTFAVCIPEFHTGRPIPDPAAETEIGFLLKACGAKLLATKDLGLSSWAKDFLKDSGQTIPTGLHKADVAIIGEAFSEFAGTTQKLISCKARIEVKAVEVETGRILAVDRATTTSVDLAENIAAKTALQKAGEQVALRIIPKIVKATSKPAAPAQPKTAK
jgi:hypothetical protein